MRSDIEAAVAHMLPVCPYKKHKSNSRSGGNVRLAHISDATLTGKSSSKSGVDLRWHTKKECALFNASQKQELYQWQQSKDGKAMIKKKN